MLLPILCFHQSTQAKGCHNLEKEKYMVVENSTVLYILQKLVECDDISLFYKGIQGSFVTWLA